MNNEKLEKANKLKKEIEELKYFIWHNDKCDNFVLKKEINLKIKCIPKFILETKQFDLPKELNDKIIKIVEEYTKKLEKEYEVL